LILTIYLWTILTNVCERCLDRENNADRLPKVVYSGCITYFESSNLLHHLDKET